MKRRGPDRRRRLLYRVRYRAGEYLLRALDASLCRLPASARPCIARITEPVSYLLLWRFRQRMHDTLERTMSKEFPSEAERRAVVRSAWRNFNRAFVETFATLYTTKEELCSRIEIKDEERLREALARKRGVIALSAHFGSFGIIGPRLVAQGYEFSVVIKLSQEPRFAALQNGYCARAGIRAIPAHPRRESVAQVIQALRRNEIVLMIPDEFKTNGVEVSFLGRRTTVPKGPITIAQRTEAAVLPVFMVRDAQNRLTLHVEPEVKFVKTGHREADLRTNARLFVREIEKMVRRHPDQWSWMGFGRSRKGSAKVLNRRLRENLERVTDGSAEGVRCSRCRRRHCRADEDWRESCKVRLRSPTEAGPLMEELTEGHRLRQLCCPSCGVLLDTDMVEANAPVRTEPYGGTS